MRTAAIGCLVRKFPDGFEARIVDEPAAGRQHWILLNPTEWLHEDPCALGRVQLTQEAARRRYEWDNQSHFQ